MRDSQSLLEQLLAVGHRQITADDVNELLGIAPAERLSGRHGSSCGHESRGFASGSCYAADRFASRHVLQDRSGPDTILGRYRGVKVVTPCASTTTPGPGCTFTPDPRSSREWDVTSPGSKIEDGSPLPYEFVVC